MTNKIDDIINEYMKKDFDFGFSEFSDKDLQEKTMQEAEKVSLKKEQQIDQFRIEILDLRERLNKVEKLIMPLLVNLLKTSDTNYIHWPNRKPAIEKQIEEILKQTRY